MLRIIKFLSLVMLLSGCAQTMEARLDTVRSSYDEGEYQKAAQVFSDDAAPKNQDNLEILISADSAFRAGDFQESDDLFEEFNRRNINLTDGDIGREAGALIAGNMANDYRPYMMDSLFVSYYQLWDALALGKNDIARVIINQAYDRQQKMSVAYADLISQAQSKLSENKALSDKLNQENSNWLVFRNIMNPALTYMSGLYFLSDGDFSDARTFLSRASGMMPENDFIKKDLELAKSKTKPKDTVWVFIEQGFAPKLYEERINMPWFVGTDMVIVSFALSAPRFFPKSKQIDGTELLTNVDALFMTEYGQYRVNEAIRAWTAAVSKATLQSALYSADDKFGPFAGLMTSVYSVASTNAEVRTWATLPKDIYLLRQDKSDLIELKSGDKIIAKIDLPQESANYLVHVRLFGSRADTKIIKLK